MTDGSWVCALIVIGGVCFMLGKDLGASVQRDYYNKRPWLPCPYQLCTNKLTAHPLLNSKECTVPEMCDVCGGSILFMYRKNRGQPDNVYVRYSGD